MTNQEYFLIVDDIDVNRFLLCEMFKEQYQILEAENGDVAIHLLKQHKDAIALIFLDLLMPVTDGFGVLEYMKKNGMLDEIPVILISVEDSTGNVERAYTYGVADYIKKPFVPSIVVRRAKNIVDLYGSRKSMQVQIKEQTHTIMEAAETIKRNSDNMIDALASVVEFRSLESGEHIRRIKFFTRIMLKYLVTYFPDCGIESEDIDSIVRASALHDLGKIGIPDSILLKPGKLTPDEFEIMKTHSLLGCDILSRFVDAHDDKFFCNCYDICKYHHERWDGRGYPEGLAGDQIPIAAQIVAITDVYDALVSQRVYKDAYTHKKAIQMILDGECGQFSPTALECFRLANDEFLNIFDYIGTFKIATG